MTLHASLSMPSRPRVFEAVAIAAFAVFGAFPALQLLQQLEPPLYVWASVLFAGTLVRAASRGGSGRLAHRALAADSWRPWLVPVALLACVSVLVQSFGTSSLLYGWAEAGMKGRGLAILTALRWSLLPIALHYGWPLPSRITSGRLRVALATGFGALGTSIAMGTHFDLLGWAPSAFLSWILLSRWLKPVLPEQPAKPAPEHEHRDRVELGLRAVGPRTLRILGRRVGAAAALLFTGVAVVSDHSLHLFIPLPLFRDVVGSAMAAVGLIGVADTVVRAVVRSLVTATLTLTPTGARLLRPRRAPVHIDTAQLQLRVTEDADGSLLVVGPNAVVASDLSVEALEARLAPLRSHLVEETPADAAHARNRLGRVHRQDLQSPSRLAWLEPGRRQAALASLVVSGLMSVLAIILVQIDPSPAALAGLAIMLAGLGLASHRLLQLARRSHDEQKHHQQTASAETTPQSGTAGRQRGGQTT